MTEKDFALFERGERVDQPDLQHAVESTPRSILTQLIEELVLGADGAPTQIWGFDTTVASPVLTVTRGAAITGYRDRGTVYRGVLLAGGPPVRTINVASYADGTYGVYVRLSLRPTAARNRRFWNALGAPAAQVLRLANTRLAEDWDLVLERASPGADYLRLGSVPITGGALGAFTRDVSRLFDSGRAGRVLTDADWGATADRNAADAIGLRGLTRWTKMAMRQIQDVIGGSWYGVDPRSGSTDGVGPRSLTQLNAEKLSRTGTNTIGGTVLPDATETRDLGSVAAAFRYFFARTLYASASSNIAAEFGTAASVLTQVLFHGAATANRGTITHDPTGGAGGNGLLELVGGGSTAGAGTVNLLAAEVNVGPIAGAATVDLRGSTVRLGRHCDGQGGIYIAAGLTTAIAGSAVGTRNYANITMSIGAATPIVPGDFVLFWQQTSGDDLNTAGLLLVERVWVSGSNQLTLRVYNPDTIVAQPPFTINPVITVVFMRRTSG